MTKVAVRSGAVVDLLRPDPRTIKLDDIAHSLANTCRFNGHTSRFYSVAEHCLIGASLTDNPKLKLGFLLHDAAEAYMGDIVTPVKHLGGGVLGVIEHELQEAISKAFGCFDKRVEYDHSRVVHLDQIMLGAEVAELMPTGCIPLPFIADERGRRLVEQAKKAIQGDELRATFDTPEAMAAHWSCMVGRLLK